MSKVKERKGIILVGGKGSRLYPASFSISKQLLHVYDKPMVYYALSTLMLGGIREILIISSSRDSDIFERLFGNGDRFGMTIKYAIQEEPKGIADAFNIAESFLDGAPVALILGDNLIHGNDLISYLINANKSDDGAHIFAYRVNDPNRYGIVEFDQTNKVISIEEKPKKPKSKYAIIGLYYYDNSVVEKTRRIKSSERGELEITSINQIYLREKKLYAEILGRGIAWFDTGTKDSLYEASGYVRSLQNRQGLIIGSPEEIAWRNKWISTNKLLDVACSFKGSEYGEYLISLPYT